MDCISTPKEPYTDAAYQGGDNRHYDKVADTAHHHQPAQDDERDGVGEEMGKTGMEPRRKKDMRQPTPTARVDAKAIQVAVEDEQVHDFDDPEHGDNCRHQGSLLFEF